MGLILSWAAAERLAISVGDIARRIAARHDIDLGATEDRADLPDQRSP